MELIAMPRDRIDPTDKYVGNRVRMCRVTRSLSQKRVGELLGLTFQQVQKYERGINRISASRLQHLAKILQAPIEFFFEGTPQFEGMTTASDVSEFTATSEGLSLIKAFTAIQKPRLRRRIVDLVEA